MLDHNAYGVAQTDKEYYAGFKANDDDIIKDFYDTYYDEGVGFVQKLGLELLVAQEVVQDGVVNLYLNIQKGKYDLQEQTKLKTYFFQICKYLAWSIARKNKKTSLSEDMFRFESKNQQAANDLEIQETRLELMEEKLELLDSKCRRILYLFYWERRALTEICDIEHLSRNSIKTTKFRCMEKLRKLVKS